MTLPSDSDSASPPPSPDDDALPAGAEDPRLTPLGPAPRVLSPLFWIMIVIGLVCVLAGAAVALLGPRLYPHNEPPIATVPR